MHQLIKLETINNSNDLSIRVFCCVLLCRLSIARCIMASSLLARRAWPWSASSGSWRLFCRRPSGPALSDWSSCSQPTRPFSCRVALTTTTTAVAAAVTRHRRVIGTSSTWWTCATASRWYCLALSGHWQPFAGSTYACMRQRWRTRLARDVNHSAPIQRQPTPLSSSMEVAMVRTAPLPVPAHLSPTPSLRPGQQQQSQRKVRLQPICW